MEKLAREYQGNSIIFAEPDPSYDYEEDLRRPDAALKQSIQHDLFVIEERSEFEFLTHGSTTQELLAFWGKASAEDDVSEEDLAEQGINEVYDRAENIRQAAGQGAEVALHERARIIRLKPNVTDK